DFSLNDTPNLPLFTPGDPDAPLVTPGAAPRAPLAVRRGGSPAAARQARPKPRVDPEPAPRLALDTAEFPVVPPPRASAHAAAAPHDDAVEEDEGVQPAGTIARLGAAAIDLTLLGGIDLIVLYFTLKICDLT